LNVPRITFDANCVINLIDTTSETATSVEELRAIVRYAMEGKLEISITTRLEADIGRDEAAQRRNALLAALNMFPVISTIGRWDTSKWDADLWANERTVRLQEEIKQIISPGLREDDPRFSNKINDIDHLVGHVIDQRDVFVTDDKGILRRRDQLHQGPGIIVMTPAECLAHVDGIALRSRPRSLPTDGIPEAYMCREFCGTVNFDYTNNNHRFLFGEGQHLFDTMWTKASNTSIHAYSDGSTMEAVAIAKGARTISDVVDAEKYDFSSRVRTAQLGEVVVWRNVNGLYGATKVLAIKDDTRGDAVNEVTLEYVLLPGGERDFSGASML